MDTWEQRMATRAAGRAVVAEAERITREPDDSHAGHHHHLGGTSVYCSCGEFQGVTCVVLDVEGPIPTCEVCGVDGVTLLYSAG